MLEHLAEADLVGQVHPLRLEAAKYELRREQGRQELHFELRVQTPEEPCMAWGGANALEGTLVLTLPENEPRVLYRLDVRPKFRLYYRSLRGPGLRIGAYGFGSRRTDAMVPGIEWLIGEEWSSGPDFHGPGNALRQTPHPHKLTIPMMVVSHEGLTVSLPWPPRQKNVDVFSRMREPQPARDGPGRRARSGR